jgi:drug/metabolite transporter (DMT)-like permease
LSTEQVVERSVEARADVAALLAGLVTVMLWGSAFVAIRDVGKSISPGSVALGRLLVSLVVLGLAAAIWREPPTGYLVSHRELTKRREPFEAAVRRDVRL